MQMRDDDVGDAVGPNAECVESLVDWLDDRAASLLGHRSIESGVDHEGAVCADDGPDVVGERLQDVVGIAAEKIFRRLPIVMRIAHRIQFVDVAHDLFRVLSYVMVGFCDSDTRSRPAALRQSADRGVPLAASGAASYQ